MRGNFSSLDLNSEIFKKIEEDIPNWWKLFLLDKSLYIDIRKDNYINIYYLGGSIAKIIFKNEFSAEIHHKYLGLKDDNKTYVSLDLNTVNNDLITDIKKRIEDTLKDSKNEHPAEKRIQGEMRVQNPNYIDSEFQFNQATNNDKLRIDLTELSNGTLTFIELKGISDNRLRNETKRNQEAPEIITQMSTYKSFIESYKLEIEGYYNKLIQIKRRLGILDLKVEKLKVNPIPKLIILNTYNRLTTGRINRIEAIEELLSSEKIDFEIIDYLIE